METIQPIPPQCGDLPQSRGMVIESKDLESMILGEVAEVDRMAAEELARKAPLAGAD